MQRNSLPVSFRILGTPAYMYPFSYSIKNSRFFIKLEVITTIVIPQPSQHLIPSGKKVSSIRMKHDLNPISELQASQYSYEISRKWWKRQKPEYGTLMYKNALNNSREYLRTLSAFIKPKLGISAKSYHRTQFIGKIIS